jgi:hypothetical protein
MTSITISSLVPSCEGQQSDVAGLLDGTRQPTLMGRADAGKAARNYLAPLGNELL